MNIEELVKKSKIAQLSIEDYSQEQTDKLVRAVGKAIFDNAQVLSQEAVEETHFGNVEGKIGKHYSVTMAGWHFMKDKKSVGVIEEDFENQVVTLAKPMGVVASITPSTNPTSTATQNAMIALKSRNSIIVAPHPNAKNCTKHAVQIMQEAIVSVGGPKDLVMVIDEPSIQATNELMSLADVVLATGGLGMVKAAYSSGKPSYGVGQGNVQSFIDEGVDYSIAAQTIIGNRSMDLGIPCTGDQTVYIPRKDKEEILNIFSQFGAAIVTDEADINKVRESVFINGAQNTKLTGKVPHEAARLMELKTEIPESAKVLMIEVDQEGEKEVLAKEILWPILRFRVYDQIEEALEWARINLLMEGAGHTATIHSQNNELIEKASLRLPVGRLMVNQPGAASSGGPFTNGLNPTISIGCGSWGNNSISENLTYRHLMNVTKVSRIIPNAVVPTPEEVWGN